MSDNQVPRKPIHCIKGKCFVTGQSCTHQSQIQRVRNENHKNHIVSVFVVMSFTGLNFFMYDIYRHELERLIKEHYWFDDSGDSTVLKNTGTKTEQYFKVKSVLFTRADLEVSTGHVICNRVCDPIQQADLIVIDVSHPNPNVFYELGLAMSMGKHVLPICFTKKYYHKEYDPNGKNQNDKNIECFPWAKELYQYFSLYCYAVSSPKKYPPFAESKEREKYTQYCFADPSNHFDVAAIMYTLLSEGVEHNQKDTPCPNDTLMLYSEKGFENPSQFPTVIQNTDKLVKAISNPELFHGDRIMIFAQDDKLYEQDKDMPTRNPIGYNVADITKYGINKVLMELSKKIVYWDSAVQDQAQDNASLYSPPHSPAFIAYGKSPLFMERIRQCAHHELKFFAHNIVFPDNSNDTNNTGNENVNIPNQNTNNQDNSNVNNKTNKVNDVTTTSSANTSYVKESYHSSDPMIDLISSSYFYGKNAKETIPEFNTPAYTYLNVMISYMRYIKQILIDTHANDIISYFWLGVCHAAGVDTVRIERNYTEADQKLEESKKTFDVSANHEIQYFKSIRSVFDVAGLWCAYVNAKNIEGFIDQLYQVEKGIYQHHHAYTKHSSEHTEEIVAQRERYYRHIFWQDMCQDSIEFCVGGTRDYQDSSKNNSPKNIRWNVGAWDEMVASLLTKQMMHYQKSTPFKVTIAPPNSETSSIETDSNSSPSTCTIYIGDDHINTKCTNFIKKKLRRNSYITHDTDNRNANPTTDTDNPPSCTSFISRSLCTKGKHLTWKQPSETCCTCKNTKTCEKLTHKDGICKFESYGGLFLYHERSKTDNSSFRNNIYIMGGNGIVTYAIASIFVEPSLQEPFIQHSECASFLSDLQRSIRNKYVKQCAKCFKIMDICKDPNQFGITVKKDYIPNIERYVCKMLSSYFLPFVTKYELTGMRRSLEFYLQELFDRDMRKQHPLAIISIHANNITDSTAPNSIYGFDEKRFWGSYTHNIPIDFLIQEIVDAFLAPLEKDFCMEAVFKVETKQTIPSDAKNYWETIQSCTLSQKRVVRR